jgi:HPC2 and ubinuclein domain
VCVGWIGDRLVHPRVTGSDVSQMYILQPKRAAAAAAGVPKDDQYDYEDNFIDDSEIIEYYAGDRRKAKHSGFFVNSGEIEKVQHICACNCCCVSALALESACHAQCRHASDCLLHGTGQASLGFCHWSQRCWCSRI